MVTVQNIGVQLTRPIKEIAEWNFPFSQTLEKYCSLFNTTYNQNFGEAGLVLQNSTAVYAHRVDSLWQKIEYFRNIFGNVEHEEETLCSSKKKERKVNMCFQEFKNINFAQEMEKNIDIRTIDIKKNHMMHNTVKSKCYRFTQLEKSSMQNVSIDIYDVNGEVIGKKYDFRCNQNINIDGILIDEFAPQDFYCAADDIANLDEFSLIGSNSHDTESLESSWNMLSSSTIQNENDDDSLEKENTNLNVSLSSTQQTSFLSGNSDRTLVETSTNMPNDDSQRTTLTSSLNETSLTLCDANLSVSSIDTTSNNNTKYLDDLSPSNSPRLSVDSRERRTSIDESDKLVTSTVQTTPRSDNTRNKRLRSTPKSSKKKLSEREVSISPRRKCNSATKMTSTRLLEEQCVSPRSKLNVLEKSLSTCVKSIQQHYHQQYEDITSETMDLLGFRLRDNTDNVANSNVMTISNDDEMSEVCSASPTHTSSSHKSLSSDIWLPTNSPYLTSEGVEKWHESMRPKLHEAEQRSTFCIHDYTSRILNVLKKNDQQKINFDTIVQKENSYEVARYFLASLDLASKQNVDIIKDDNLENNIEIVLREENGECLADDQTNSHE